MTHEELHRRLQVALDVAGNLHTLDDILSAVEIGDMQSFAEGNTWAITQICDYPRRRVLDVLYVVGELDEVDSGYRRIIDFACEHRCTLVRAYGRNGWRRFLSERDWTTQSAVYHKELL